MNELYEAEVTWCIDLMDELDDELNWLGIERDELRTILGDHMNDMRFLRQQDVVDAENLRTCK
jgi:hypothetical protein